METGAFGRSTLRCRARLTSVLAILLGSLGMNGVASANFELEHVASYEDGGSGGSNLGEPTGIHGVPGQASVPDRIYVASFEDAITVFDLENGRLQFVETIADGTSDNGMTVDGLSGATRIGSAEDSIVVTAQGDNAIASFRPTSSGLDFVDVERDGVNDPGDAAGTADGLASPWDVVGAGSRIYVAGRGEDEVGVFSAFDGELSYLGRISDNFQGAELGVVSGLARTSSGIAAIASDPGGLTTFDSGPFPSDVGQTFRGGLTGATFGGPLTRNDDSTGFEDAFAVATPGGIQVFGDDFGDLTYGGKVDDGAWDVAGVEFRGRTDYPSEVGGFIATDFEGDAIRVYDYTGKEPWQADLVQTFSPSNLPGLSAPNQVTVFGLHVFVSNFGGNSIEQFLIVPKSTGGGGGGGGGFPTTDPGGSCEAAKKALRKAKKKLKRASKKLKRSKAKKASKRKISKLEKKAKKAKRRTERARIKKSGAC